MLRTILKQARIASCAGIRQISVASVLTKQSFTPDFSSPAMDTLVAPASAPSQSTARQVRSGSAPPAISRLSVFNSRTLIARIADNDIKNIIIVPVCS